MIGKLGYGHICLREENLSFNNNYMYTCVRGIDIASFNDFSIVFSNNSDSVVLFVSVFYVINVLC
jgi:hypothetical protein